MLLFLLVIFLHNTIIKKNMGAGYIRKQSTKYMKKKKRSKVPTISLLSGAHHAASASRHHAAYIARHQAASTSRHHAAYMARHHAAPASWHHAAYMARHHAAPASRHYAAYIARYTPPSFLDGARPPS